MDHIWKNQVFPFRACEFIGRFRTILLFFFSKVVVDNLWDDEVFCWKPNNFKLLLLIAVQDGTILFVRTFLLNSWYCCILVVFNSNMQSLTSLIETQFSYLNEYNKVSQTFFAIYFYILLFWNKSALHKKYGILYYNH